MNKIVEPNVKINSSVQSQDAIQNFESAFRGENDRDALPRMATQSKSLTIPNTNLTTESLDSAAFCVCVGEKKKQRIGVRLTISEREALERAAKENNMTLSNWFRQIAQNFAQQKSA